MGLPRVNLVVVGHKDHGKSTLIGRLLYDSGAIPEQKLREIREELKASGKEFEFAYIMDSLEEERTGGLTIDIMQTPFRSGKYDYVIIDCPGHREFIRKMLTGASQADAAILVVSAVDGVEDQTRQHAFLIKTLGIMQLVVAVNKMDLASYSEEAFRSVSGKVRELLSSLGYGDVPVVPVSAFEGDNVVKPSVKMKWYDGGSLVETLDRTVRPVGPPLDKPLRCVVQDVYRLDGEEVVVCKVETGVLRVGSKVLVMPNNEIGFLRSIEVFGEKKNEALPGDSVGLIIDGIRNVRRGCVICDPNHPVKVAREFLAELIVFSDIRIMEGDRVTVRVGTAEVECSVEELIEKIDPVSLRILECKPRFLGEGEVGRAILRASEPVCIEAYKDVAQLGRFVIIGRTGTTAAGIIMDVSKTEEYMRKIRYG